MSEQRFRVFILEDDPNRQQEFRERFRGADVPEHIVCQLEFADNIQTAARILTDANPFDLVLLDHDLCVEHYRTLSQIASGSALTKWLSEHPDVTKRHKRYLAHSLNASGVALMAKHLWQLEITCLHVPFLWEKSIFWKHVRFPPKV
jgi:CheY-like chemotaxis protein